MGNMTGRKFIFATVLSALLITANAANAESNDLLRMDVKKASSDNTVDVTFYTTGNPSNTVVTRKSDNTYVVLLPNVAGTQSIVPSLGGVKDLVSNVNIKNVDDGIGGYTKVTFNTTKPVKIQTYTKKTAPLTKAQQDYKNLIAQNSKYDPDKKMENFKQTKTTASNTNKVVNTTATQTKQNPAPAKQQTEAKTTAVKTTPKAATQNTNKIALKPIDIKIPQVKTEETKTVSPAVSEPKNIEPKTEVKDQIQETPPVAQADVKPAFDLPNPPIQSNNVSKTNAESTNNIITKIMNKDLSVFNLAGILSALGIIMLGIVMNIIARAVKNNTKLKDYLENYNPEQKNVINTEYNEILKKDNLNWQEKYKLYSEVKENENADNPKPSYVTNMKGTKGTVIRNDVKKRVMQMEHAFSQIPSIKPPQDSNNEVQSEDNAISKQMSGLNLKTFSKHRNLKQTDRKNISEETQTSATNPLKEGRFVNLANSALTMSRRNIGGHGYSISDLVRTSKRYLSPKQDSEAFSNKQDEYIISSLEDYLKIVESEEPKEITNEYSDVDMMFSTNPIAQSKQPEKVKDEAPDYTKIVISSKYDIDENRSIYMVEFDGISALIGKIGENITVLKKFDKIIKKPLQVRLDYGNVYIAKVGNFKCLVDVEEDNIGTLLEI